MAKTKINSKCLFVALILLLTICCQRVNSSYELNSELTNEEELVDLSAYGDEIYGEPDVKTTGVLVSSMSQNLEQNPEELGTYFEGDILIPLSSDAARNGIIATSSRWPGGIVPYEIKGKFTSQELAVIEHAFAEYHAKTCVRFKPRTKESDYISIVSEKSGCWSSVGRLGGRQQVNLQAPNCLRKYGTAIHELMHALGFFHEQNRYERDEYVKVLNENVKPEMLVNFEKSSPKVVNGYGVIYDYASVMHYSPTSFSKNGKATLKALRQTPEARLMGQRTGLSKGDVRKINIMYKCK